MFTCLKSIIIIHIFFSSSQQQSIDWTGNKRNFSKMFSSVLFILCSIYSKPVGTDERETRESGVFCAIFNGLSVWFCGYFSRMVFETEILQMLFLLFLWMVPSFDFGELQQSEWKCSFLKLIFYTSKSSTISQPVAPFQMCFSFGRKTRRKFTMPLKYL